MYITLSLAVVVTCIVTCTLGYPDAAPAEACGSMMPNHGASAQTSSAPYEIMVSGTCYKSGTQLRVTVKSNQPDEYYFEGFMLQARVTGSATTAYGTYALESDSEIKTLDCLSDTTNAVGHNDHKKWIRKTFVWTAGSSTDDLKFQATVVKGKTTFWTEIMSDMISYDAACTASASDKPTGSDIFDSAAGYFTISPLLLVISIIVILFK